MKTVYYFMGYDTDRLDRIIEAAKEKLEMNDNHLILKNGDDIEVYIDGDNWTIIDSPEYGGETTVYELGYLAIIEIMKMSRRGIA